MKYLRHIEKGILVPFNPSISSPEWEVYEEPSHHDEEPAPEPIIVSSEETLVLTTVDDEEPKVRKKPGPKPKVVVEDSVEIPAEDPNFE